MASEERHAEVRALVLEHDSYAEAARILGLSRERVRQIAGNGLTSTANPKRMTCIDCRRKYTGLGNPRCERCRTFFQKWGEPRTPEAIKRHRTKLKSHCQRGHELTEKNIYAYMTGGRMHRQCRVCFNSRRRERNRTQKGQARIREYNRRAYEKLKADPQRWERMLELRRKWSRERYEKDPEYRERVRAATRRYQARKRGKTPAA